MKDPRFPDIKGNLDLSVLAFDLDGVLAKSTWPHPYVGEPILEGINALRHYATHGWSCVIHTARPASHEERIWKWVHQHNLQWYVYDVVCDKFKAAAYIDDKAIRFPFTQEAS